MVCEKLAENLGNKRLDEEEDKSKLVKMVKWQTEYGRTNLT